MADEHFRGIAVTSRIKDKKAYSISNTVESSPQDINNTAGAGRWSFPNSAPEPGKGVHRERIDIEEPPYKDMIEQAHHMKISYDTAVKVKPEFKAETKRCTATSCYQILKERQRTAELYKQKCGRYEESGMSTPVPTIEYPGAIGKQLEMRFLPRDISTSFEKGLETAAARRDHLSACLNPTNEKIPRITADAKQDLEYCSQLSNEHDNTLVEHPEFERFQKPAPRARNRADGGERGEEEGQEEGEEEQEQEGEGRVADGLVVHGLDMKHKIDSTSSLSAFFSKSYNILRKDNVVLTHSIGLSTAGRSRDNEHLKGSSGLFRSLCAQLIAYEGIGTQLSLRWLNNKRLHEAGMKKTARLSLALFFRDLLFDVAESAANQSIQMNVRVLIDGVDRIERDKTLSDVIAVFRSIVNELEFGPFGDHLTFRYLLLHPQISHLAVELYLNERHIFLGRRLESREPRAEAKTRSKKSKCKAKAKREKVDPLDGSLEDDERSEDNNEEDSLLEPQEICLHLLRSQVYIKPELRAQAVSILKSHRTAIDHQLDQRAKAYSATPTEQSLRMKYFLMGDGLDPDMPKGNPAITFLTFWTPELPPIVYKDELSCSEARNEALMDALRDCQLPLMKGDETHYDPKRVQQYLRQDNIAQISSLALEHPEIIHFSKILSGGLVLHGMNTTYVQTTQQPVTPFAGLLSGVSVASANTMRLTYAAGLDLLNDPAAMTTQTSTSGVPACVRNLCLQLLQQPLVTRYGLKLYFFNDTHYEIDTRKGSLPPLLTLFRLLVLDLAYLVYNNENVQRQVIELVIDGANWLERDHGHQFVSMVKFFRQLSREIHCSQACDYVGFKYLLIHPQICQRLIERPEIPERHLFWGWWQAGNPYTTSTGTNLDPRQQHPHTRLSRQQQMEHFVDALRSTRSDNDVPENEVKAFFLNHELNLKALEVSVKKKGGSMEGFPGFPEDHILEVWSSSRKAILIPHPPDFDTPGKRRHHLESALNTGIRGGSRTALARQDRRKCAAQYMDADIRSVLEMLFIHEYMLDLRDGRLHGLVIHSDLLPGKKIPFPGELSNRMLAAFVNIHFFEESRQGTIVLTHITAPYAAKRGIDEKRDGAWILRSLCCQLVETAFRKYKKPMDMEWMDAALRLRLGDCELPYLCRLFRDLLCDLATYLARSGKPKERILVIVDCSESVGSPDIDLTNVIDTFRFVIDEAAVCELGNLIDFNYILLRPVMDRHDISPNDRHLFLERIMDELSKMPIVEVDSDDGEVTQFEEDEDEG